MLFNFIISPLEQFQVIPLIPINFGILDFTITNANIILIILLFFSFVLILNLLTVKDSSFYIIPNKLQSIIEIIYSAILSLVVDNIKSRNATLFFPIIFSIFLFVLSLNLLGLIPYSFCLTSHLIVTLGLSIAVFIGINIICIRIHGLVFFSLFLPSGTSAVLAFLLVPVEFVSYLFKPISLSIRLFANMMAGHALLKVVAGFSFSLMNGAGFVFLLHTVPILVLIPLFGLELVISFIQSFVFCVLISIYLNDSINLH